MNNVQTVLGVLVVSIAILTVLATSRRSKVWVATWSFLDVVAMGLAAYVAIISDQAGHQVYVYRSVGIQALDKILVIAVFMTVFVISLAAGKWLAKRQPD